MNNLLIIGNGFDILHAIKTKYKHFYDYLCEEYDIKSNEIPENFVIQNKLTNCGDYEFSDIDLAQLLVYTILSSSSSESMWNNLEELLGQLDHFEYLSQIIEFTPNDSDCEINQYHLANNMQQYSLDLKEAISIGIKKLFKDWVYTIDVNSPNHRQIQRLIDQSNHILTFNYTQTVQQIYNKKNVTHIHGSANNRDDFILGHNNSSRTFIEYDKSHYFYSASSIQKLHNNLLKNTSQQILLHKNFFESLSMNSKKLDNIYSIGFSFGGVDLPYILEIVSHTNEQTTWTNYVHDLADCKNHKEKIILCGFSGQIICKQSKHLLNN